MAKDGTMRGGARLGSGKKRKALTDRINEGQTAEVIDFEAVDLIGNDMPSPKEYLKEKQKSGGECYCFPECPI